MEEKVKYQTELSKEQEQGNLLIPVVGGSAILSQVYNEDCVTGMKRYADKYFDLAVVDPPYGLGEKLVNGGTWAKKLTKNDSKWDIKPTDEYWSELWRVSKNQIIWGGNYYNMPPTRGFIVWDKKLTDNWTMAMAEFAWTSFDQPSKIYRGLTDNGSRGCERIHICQKPIKLYEWIYKFYASEGNLILDTHLGSGSSRIAAHKAGLSFTGFEIDKEYYEAQERRFKIFVSQGRLW